MTAAMTPESPSSSAGMYAANPLKMEIVISVGGSSRRRRIHRSPTPTSRPTAIPPMPVRTNFGAAHAHENEPVTTAVIPKRYSVSAVQSFVRFSPSMIVTTRRGTPKRRMIWAGATASVGETTAPSTKATLHGRPMSSCAITATAPVVTKTRPTASQPIDRTLALSSRGLEKKAAPYRSGGRKISRTRSGSSVISPTPGTNPTARPPRTSAIGYGTWTLRARIDRPAIATSRPRMVSSR